MNLTRHQTAEAFLARCRAELERKVPPLIAEGGYLPRIDHSVGADISLEHFRYYMQVLQELYGMGVSGGPRASQDR